MPATLAQEMIDAIIDYLYADKPSLLACSLTAKQFLPASQYHILTRIHVRPTNIQSFLDILAAPSCNISFCVRRVLVNGFSQSIVANVNPLAKDHLRRLSLHLRDVKFLRLVNSQEVAVNLLSSMSTVEELEFAQMYFQNLDDLLDIIYAFPRLRCLSIQRISIYSAGHQGYNRHPGVGSSFYIREVRASHPTLIFFYGWLQGLNPVPPIQLAR